MERAVVLIGVRKAGSLTELQAALDGVHAMEHWAIVQGIDRRSVLTDELDEVRVGDIADVIAAIVDIGTVQQLIVYVAGHGVNRIYTEYWLLSRAPMWPGEAVNVAASAELARRCGIPHVVFISDACRTAPEGIGAQAVTGTPIFPNNPGLPDGTVDQFFATRVGDAAHEVRVRFSPRDGSGPPTPTSSCDRSMVATSTCLSLMTIFRTRWCCDRGRSSGRCRT